MRPPICKVSFPAFELQGVPGSLKCKTSDIFSLNDEFCRTIIVFISIIVSVNRESRLSATPIHDLLTDTRAPTRTATVGKGREGKDEAFSSGLMSRSTLLSLLFNLYVRFFIVRKA